MVDSGTLILQILNRGGRTLDSKKTRPFGTIYSSSLFSRFFVPEWEE